jgi:adenylosuccinate synthase
MLSANRIRRKTPEQVISFVKTYFEQEGYVIDDPTGRGVEADFRLKKGKTKRDPVRIIDVDKNNVEIRISQITNEKRYVFRWNGMYFITTGRTLEKYLNHNKIALSKIKRFKRINVREITNESSLMIDGTQNSRMDLVYSFQLYNAESSIDVSLPVLSIVVEMPQTCITCRPPAI